MKKLYDLINNIDKNIQVKLIGIPNDLAVTGITDNTKNVANGNIFACIKGKNFDGHDAAKEMIAAGAVCVVTEKNLGRDIPQILVKDSRTFYGHLCAAWNDHPEKKLKLVGITGTNGKTTTATMLYNIIRSNGIKAGLIGTTGVLIDGREIERDGSTPTTPRVDELYSIFAQMAASGCTVCVMEVTSFALEQNRIGPAHFKIAAFTNLTQDHLDYHENMNNYFNAKKMLFSISECAFINVDDSYGKQIYDAVTYEKYSCSIAQAGKTSIYASDIRHTSEGMKFWYSMSKATSVPVTLNMVGKFNVLNAEMAISMAIKLGVPAANAVKAISRLEGVRGRCEIIPTGKDFSVVCDYAHSPDALEKLLPAIKECTEGRLVVLFGCGGNRDSAKRPLMAQAVQNIADRIIVTSDNPRNEDPDMIIDDIVAGFAPNVKYERITDRKEAIFHAINTAQKGDVIVLAGKGHEDYQILAGDVHIHFDEREIVAECLAEHDKKPVAPPPKKREKLTLDEICQAVEGKSYGLTYNGKTTVYVDEISSDTRNIKAGSLFIGIRGEKFNGNDFAEKAINENGAVCAITDRVLTDVPCIVVKDTRKALLELSGYFRRKYNIVVTGVTGSVGKTTSKELIHLAMSSKFRTMKTEGNHNNEIGLPFTLFNINSKTQAAVIEMGMSNFGEITKLSEAAKPDICIITNIGYSHIENLGSRDGILKAKLEILNGAEPNAPLIVNGDDYMLRNVVERSRGHRVILCGVSNKNCEYRAENIVSENEKTQFDIVYKGMTCARCTLPMVGKHFVIDALLAVAAAHEAGCDIQSAADSFKYYSAEGLRQHIEKHGDQTLLIDCYNAAPDSVKAAIDVLMKMTPEDNGRRICVLGDMLELGSMSEKLHREIGDYLVEKGVDMAVCFGKSAKFIAENAESKGLNCGCAETREEAVEYLRNTVRKGDILLFKGSRGMKMEKIIEALYE